MSDMLSYSVQLLNAISTWLMSEPMIWIVSLLILCFAFKIFKLFLPRV